MPSLALVVIAFWGPWRDKKPVDDDLPLRLSLRLPSEAPLAPAGAMPDDRQITVVPRLGTISPWASKATDIARNCALPVRRIERGRLYGFSLSRPLTDGEGQDALRRY